MFLFLGIYLVGFIITIIIIKLIEFNKAGFLSVEGSDWSCTVNIGVSTLYLICYPLRWIVIALSYLYDWLVF